MVSLTPAEVKEARMFYRDSYDRVGDWQLGPGERIFLGGEENRCKENRRCRFCGKRSPEVTFDKKAHAAPEMLGNKTLFTYYECDTCNALFGEGIENDFGNWSKPMRTITMTPGKNGVPTITQRAWRIEGADYGLKITNHEDDPVFDYDEYKKQITFKGIPRDPYTPVAVLKTFVKIGLTLLPDGEMPNFQFALGCLQEKEHGKEYPLGYNILQTFIPGSHQNVPLMLAVFRRKEKSIETGYTFLILSFGNWMFQVFLPTPERDQHLDGKELSIPGFSSSFGLQHRQLDLTGSTEVRGEVFTPVMSYGSRVPIVPSVTS